MKLILSTLLCAALVAGHAQNIAATQTEALYNLSLKCIEGGVFAGQEVTFTNGSGLQIKGKSDATGMARVLLPVGASFVLKVKNFSQTSTVSIPNAPYITMNNELVYSKNDLAFEQKYTMTASQAAALDRDVAKLPDTTTYAASANLRPSAMYSSLEIILNGLDGKPLVNEMVILAGRKNKKAFKGRTGADGSITLLLPKGDTYELSFKYDKNYDTHEVKCLMGTMEAQIQIDYIGSVETERRIREKKQREKEEAERQAREKKEFEEYMKKAKLTAEQAHKKELQDYLSGKLDLSQNEVMSVLERNKQWKNMLIVCDLTGSMSPYAAQLSMWYRLTGIKEKDAQFVFFNDAETKVAEQRRVGETGNCYYLKPANTDDLINKIATVQSLGNGGWIEENNVEALLVSQQLAKPYKELVMIADNNSAVNDMLFLDKLNVPVHIILCGVDSRIEPDYLRIAYKTKGSVHTIEEDITSLGKMLDGQDVHIKGRTYRLMKGKFIEIVKS